MTVKIKKRFVRSVHFRKGYWRKDGTFVSPCIVRSSIVNKKIVMKI